MVDAGACVNDHGAKGRTVLHIAAKHGHVASIEPLIKLGADVSAVDRKGWTPLHHAARGHHLEVLAILLKYRSSTSKKQRRAVAAPIASALQNDSAYVKKLLMDAEINIYERGTLEGGGTLPEQLTLGRNGV